MPISSHHSNNTGIGQPIAVAPLSDSEKHNIHLRKLALTEILKTSNFRISDAQLLPEQMKFRVNLYDGNFAGTSLGITMDYENNNSSNLLNHSKIQSFIVSTAIGEPLQKYRALRIEGELLEDPGFQDFLDEAISAVIRLDNNNGLSGPSLTGKGADPKPTKPKAPSGRALALPRTKEAKTPRRIAV